MLHDASWVVLTEGEVSRWEPSLLERTFEGDVRFCRVLLLMCPEVFDDPRISISYKQHGAFVMVDSFITLRRKRDGGVVRFSCVIVFTNSGSTLLGVVEFNACSANLIWCRCAVPYLFRHEVLDCYRSRDNSICMKCLDVVIYSGAVIVVLAYLHEIFCVSGIECICPEVDVPL